MQGYFYIFADSVYNGPNLHNTLAKFANCTIEIVERTAAGFEVLPRRWVVEPTLAWRDRNWPRAVVRCRVWPQQYRDVADHRSFANGNYDPISARDHGQSGGG